MGGMGGGLSTNDPTVVAAFHRALLQGGLVVLVLIAVLFVVWRLCRAMQLRAASIPGSTAGDRVGETGSGSAEAPTRVAEAPARRLLRIGFGLLWLLDGVLQGQASMPLGMIPNVVQPASNGSPGWVVHLVDSASSVWSYHPATAAASAVWIQVGLGLFLLVGGPGLPSRLAGVASAAWGLVVWIFGEAFGAIFAPGLTWLFGAPGAALFYVLAGVLIALPESVWTSDRLGRWMLRGAGGFLFGMAILQAWPGRGFWRGQRPAGSSPGSLTAMVQQMSTTPQPHLLSSTVGAFARFDAGHAWAVNLFAVAALAVIGSALASGRPAPVRYGLIAVAVLCLADWLLIEDLGFLGGTGTDPNSMIPILLLIGGGYLAFTRVPAEAPAQWPMAAATPWRQRLIAEPAYALRLSAAVAAVGITLVGAAPMAVAATQSTASPILATAIAGPPTLTDIPAPEFRLTDQNGRPVSLADLHGDAAVVTFLDPVCTTDCPVIASELRDADNLLGPDASRVRLVAIDANSQYTTTPFLQAFDRQDGLQNLANWSYLSGSVDQLRAVWAAFGVDVEAGVGGSMMSHSDVAYLLDSSGHIREVINSDPGPATAATASSFADLFAGAIQHLLHQ